MKNRPVIAISAGDPAGIGPEIIAKAFASKGIFKECRPFVVCDKAIMQQAVRICDLETDIHVIQEPTQGKYQSGTIDVLDMHNVDIDAFEFGKVAAMTGEASFQYIRRIIALAMDREADATVTAPIHKEALNQAGYSYAGHTEIFGEFTSTSDYAMMLADGDFRVVHVSTHVSLRKAIDLVKQDRVLRVIQLAHEALKNIGIEKPRIAVNGLNPHAGERGLFGREELDEIIPAIDKAREGGIHADGPHPPDTVFSKLKGGEYDIVVCMYHDQGHIPTKLTGFQYDHKSGQWQSISGVNITLGLPIIRVSVDHGTAFDKAGKGTANPESMLQAIEYAAMLAGK